MVALAQMKSKLLTLNQAREDLSLTEPLGVIPVDADTARIRWSFNPEWATMLDTTHGTGRIQASVFVGKEEYQLTKDAVLTAASAFGLPAAHAKQLPAHLMEQEMNYWFGAGLGKRQFNLLTIGNDEVASAFVKATKRPFSNLALLDALEKQIRTRMGNTEILVDYKFSHSLAKTDIRLVLPDFGHIIDSSTADDEWTAGIHLSNSLIASSQTSVEPYLFRWVCTNGATSQYGDGGVWNRRLDGQREEDVLLWAQREVDDIFAALPAKWAQLQKLNEVSIEGSAEAILREVFRTYKVPYTQQNEIIDQLADADGELTMYDLMQAITSLANDPQLKPERADTLMRVGGSIPTALFDPLNRKLWDEGHTASPDAPNPYEV